jgi:hypothetical protein
MLNSVGLEMKSASERIVMTSHKQRDLFLASRCRFDMIAAGRRSGKTEEARWRLIAGTKHRGGIHYGCLTPPPGVKEPTFIYAAPTYAQAKRIVWERFKAEIPDWMVLKRSEADMTIIFRTGARLIVAGMDKPERVEGIAIDGCVMDEFADMKPGAWTSSIRPALSTAGRPPGWALFIGRPRGKNHFYRMHEAAKTKPDWGVYYPWPSSLVMSATEVESARQDLDQRSFDQEYGGMFIESSGAAYYQFGEHNLARLEYDPTKDLQFSFDFNVNPGVAVVSQDHQRDTKFFDCPQCDMIVERISGESCPSCAFVFPQELMTGVIGEVFRWNIDSNTRLVCEELIDRWGERHKGRILCYGDATGGARRTSAERSDWQTIEAHLAVRWPDITIDVNRSNPGVRDRLVTTNSRFMSANGNVRILLDPEKAPQLKLDLESTTLKGNGDLSSGPEGKFSHISDALGYLVCQRFASILYTDNYYEDDFTTL